MSIHQLRPLTQREKTRLPKNEVQQEFGHLDRIGVITEEITPRYLQHIYQDAQSYGDLGRLYELFYKIIKYDSRIQGLVEKRRKAPSRFNWYLVKNDATDINAVEAADKLQMILEDMKLKTMYRAMMDGVFYGLTAFEKVWFKDNDHMVMSQPVQISQSRLGQYNELMKSPKWGLPYMLGKDQTDKLFFHEMNPYKYFLASYEPKRGYYDLNGILRPVAKWFMLKYFAVKFWVQYSEVYGFPVTTLQMSKEEYKDNKTEIDEFVQNIGRNRFGVYFNGMTYDIKPVGESGSTDIFRLFCAYCDIEMAIGIAGQNLSTEVIKGGSYASSVSHKQIEEELTVDDCEWIDELIQDEFVADFYRINYPSIDPRAYAKFYTKVPRKADPKAAEIKYNNAAKHKIPVSRTAFFEDFGLTEPADKADTLVLEFKEVEETNPDPNAKRDKDEREDGGSVANKK